MNFPYCLNKKQKLRVNNIIKESFVCGLFKINSGSLLNVKTFFLSLKVKIMILKKNMLISKLNDLIKGRVILVFNVKICDFNLFDKYFFNSNFSLICLCFFFFKRFIYFNDLGNIFKFENNSNFFHFFISLSRYCVSKVLVILKN